MLAFAVRLLHGTIRAGTPDDTVLAGDESSGEWPPSPARLYSALVSADGTGTRCTATTGEELVWLEGLGPPLIVASAPEAVLSAVLEPRYVVVDASAQGAVQGYPARIARKIYPGVKLAPRDDTVVYLWPDAQPTTVVLRALAYRAARIGYLGCADSPVSVSVSDRSTSVLADAWRPDDHGSLTLPVPYPGFLDALDRAYLAWSAGQAMRRSWIPSRRVRYQPPKRPGSPLARSTRQVIWFRFERPISSRRLLRMTETLKAALLDHLQRLLPGEELPSAFHGHRTPDQRGSQADFLALPDVGHTHATGRLLGAAISLPGDIDTTLVRHARTAALRLAACGLACPASNPSTSQGFQVQLAVYGGEPRPAAIVPRRWSRPSRSWVSATPIVHERWTKGRPSVDEVRRWCLHAGLPEDIGVTDVTFSKRPLIAGGLDLPPSLIYRSSEDRRPYSHAMIRFDRPVEGPIVLGRARQFGMGLLAPIDDQPRVTPHG